MSKPIKILQGRATITPPKGTRKYWRIAYYHPITGKRHTTDGGGKTRKSAEARAAELVGDWSPLTRSEKPPTLRDVFNKWMDDNRHRWSSRTYDQYKYQAGHFIKHYGDYPISEISPQDFRKVDVSHLSRGQQTKVRSLIRGTMKTATLWIQGDPDDYASAIRISGSRSDNRSYEVSRGDVASGRFINDVINLCYSTCQVHPVIDRMMRGAVSIDPATGAHSVKWHNDDEEDPMFNGLPPHWVQEHHRRGMPKHYKNIEKRMKDETGELAKRYRMFALAVAIAAGAGLRIGEILALRVRDFVSNERHVMEDVFLHIRDVAPENQLRVWHDKGYVGKLEINKQASQTGSGRIVLSKPKYDQKRTVYLPAVLYHPQESSPYLRQIRRTQVINAGLTQFEDMSISLWDMDYESALHIWDEQNNAKGGLIPLGWLLLNRLNDLWDDLHRNSVGTKPRFDDFQKLLLFPTRSKQRKNSKIEVPSNWHEDPAIVDGFGAYHSTTNFANNLTNPIFDYVSAKTGSYPQHRQSLPSNKRKGWTMHALRHFFITSNIYHGIPLPQISELAGHASVDFTLSRYSHAMKQDYEDIGFE